MSEIGKTDELVQASFDGHLDHVRALLEEGVDINGMGASGTLYMPPLKINA